MTSVLITGAAGAIGTALCKRLEASTHDTVGIDAVKPRFSHNVPIETCDLHSSPSLPESDIIVHLAAHARVPPIINNPSLAFENVALLEPVLEHARRTNAHVIFVSSREIYHNAINAREDDVPQRQANPYGASKLAGEALLTSYRETYAVPTTVLRLSNVYGPYDENTRVLPIFISLADAGEKLKVFGSRKLLDFVHSKTVTEVIERIINKPQTFDGEVVNVGSGQGTTLTELAERVVNEVSPCPGYEVVEGREGETTRYVANIERFQSLFNLSPDTLDKRLPEVIDWYRSHPAVLADIRSQIR